MTWTAGLIGYLIIGIVVAVLAVRSHSITPADCLWVVPTWPVYAGYAAITYFMGLGMTSGLGDSGVRHLL